MTTSYYIPDLMEEFYNGFAKSNILDDSKSFKLQWGGEIHTIHCGAISAVTDVLFCNWNEIPFAIE